MGRQGSRFNPDPKPKPKPKTVGGGLEVGSPLQGFGEATDEIALLARGFEPYSVRARVRVRVSQEALGPAARVLGSGSRLGLWPGSVSGLGLA